MSVFPLVVDQGLEQLIVAVQLGRGASVQAVSHDLPRSEKGERARFDDVFEGIVVGEMRAAACPLHKELLEFNGAGGLLVDLPIEHGVDEMHHLDNAGQILESLELAHVLEEVAEQLELGLVGQRLERVQHVVERDLAPEEPVLLLVQEGQSTTGIERTCACLHSCLCFDQIVGDAEQLIVARCDHIVGERFGQLLEHLIGVRRRRVVRLEHLVVDQVGELGQPRDGSQCRLFVHGTSDTWRPLWLLCSRRSLRSDRSGKCGICASLWLP